MNKLKSFVALLLVLFVLSPVHAQTEKPAVMVWNSGDLSGQAHQLIAMNLQGEVIYDIRLASSSAERVWSVGVAHNGQHIAMVVVNETAETADLRVFDLLMGQIILEYALPYNQELEWYWVLIGSRNFSVDDQHLAIGHYIDEESGWQILVFDLDTAEVIATLSSWDSRVRGIVPIAFQPVIYHFSDNIITFAPRERGPSIYTPEQAEYASLDWNVTSDTLVPTCLHTHFEQDTFIPTNETIEAATAPMSLWAGCEACPPPPFEGDFVLQLALPSPKGTGRQVFFQNIDYPLRYPTFVQGGERVATWGTPPTDEQSFPPFLNRLWILERSGVIVDELEVRGGLRLAGTPDGFFYMPIETEFSPWVNILTYVNTRSENPFANRKVIWQSEPNTFFDLIWADNQINGPLPESVPWENRIAHDAVECLVNRG